MKQMAKILAVAFFGAVLWAVDAQQAGSLVCFDGRRVTQQNGAISTNSYAGRVCNSTYDCVKATFQVGQEKHEYSSCINGPANYNCSSVANLVNITSYDVNCLLESCRSFGCNAFNRPAGCRQTPLDDIAVLPNCTMKEVLRKGFACATPLLNGYPYSDINTCKSAIDSALSCGVNLLKSCLGGPCPTVLDTVPEDLRKIYQIVVQTVENMTSLSAIYTTFHFPADLQAVLNNGTCLQPVYLASFAKMLNKQQKYFIFPNPVCDDYAILDITKWLGRSIPNLIKAKTRSEFCEIFANLKVRAIYTWEKRCNKTKALSLLFDVIPQAYKPMVPVIKKAVTIVENFIYKLSFGQCPDVHPTPAVPIITGSGPGPVCYTGRRTRVLDKVLETNYYGKVCPEGNECYLWIVRKNDSSTGVVREIAAEYADCSNYSGVACEVIASKQHFTKPYTCETSKECSTFACNQPSLVGNCNNQVPVGDVQILPQCTLKQGLDQLETCVAPLAGGLPYTDISVCLADYDKMLKCSIASFTSCVSGPCPTVLDSLPVDIRSIYPILVQPVANYTSIEAVFKVLNLSAAMQGTIQDSMCLKPGSSGLQNVSQLLTALPANFSNYLVFDNPVCDKYIVKDLFNWSLAMIPKVVDIQNHAQLCGLYNKWIRLLETTWTTRCSRLSLSTWLSTLIPAPYAPLLPEVDKAIDIVLARVFKYEIPGCIASTSGSPGSFTAEQNIMMLTIGGFASLLTGYL